MSIAFIVIFSGLGGIVSGMCGLFWTKQPIKYAVINLPYIGLVVYLASVLFPNG